MNDRTLTSEEIKRLLHKKATWRGKSYTIDGIGSSILGVSLLLKAGNEELYVPLQEATVDGANQVGESR